MIFEKQILNTYRGMLHSRCDDKGTAFYFSADDFPGLNKEEYAFVSLGGHNLQGYIYNYDNFDKNRIIVFDHGFGGGHRSYMKEIEVLCRGGYRVFAYDHTGCMQSGGDTPLGMAQSLADLDDCINAIKSDPEFDGLDISVIGHSWGGFAAMNIPALHPDISHVVSISGFVSPELLVNSFFGGIMKGYRGAIMKLENESNPKFVKYNAAESLANTEAKVLLIYSDNDAMVKKSIHFDALKERLSGKSNVRFMLVSGKGHNPNYTTEAVKYLASYSKLLKKKMRKKQLETKEQRAEFISSLDWNKMTEQDETVWHEIFESLK